MMWLTAIQPEHIDHLLRFRLFRIMLVRIYNAESTRVPRCEVDSGLRDQVHRFVSENGLTVNGAATLLGLNRTTFWRFHETGEALDSTRTRIREALSNQNKGTAARVAHDAVGTDRSEHQVRPMPQGVLVDRDLKQIRKVCESVLALLHVYEAQQSLARKI